MLSYFLSNLKKYLERFSKNTAFTHVNIYPIPLPVSIVKLTTVVDGDQKAPFSIAITPRCRKGATPFPGLFHFTLDTYLILLSVKQ